ncbi:NnrS family protein [Ramlibacter alkalitolerans]|uniref:NnrS family protein n=1 Tax=Ramlibacter alkalitolerans TaxID=2039631 RepID=A0ABS1JNN3_9BURK|nr:NnrS family protein [Ramlibacter alkalitolerans]MBL0425875.1 NnrS family protein [Ramlibacter alkalitolerans]
MPTGRDDARIRPPERPLQRGPWRAASLLSSPHKLCFFWAGIQWAVAALWWALHQFAQAVGAGWSWQVPPAAAHGLWFSLGPMPLFIAGFMFTAGPKWLRQPPVDARALRLPVAGFTAGWALAAMGFQAGALLAAAGLGLAALAWSVLAMRLLLLVTRSTETDRMHPKALVAGALAIGACLAASAVAVAIGRADALGSLARLGLWWGIATVFIVVSHRMLPFLGDGGWPRLDARWPAWPLWLLASVPAVQGAAALAPAWLAPRPGWRWLIAAHLALAAAASLRLSLRWLGTPPLKQPMVAMLFRPLLWWNAALVLGAFSWLPAIAPALGARLEMAALHALSLGYLGGTMLAMVTRVSSTHSGRPHPIDAVARRLNVLLQVTVFARVAAALWPASAVLLLPVAGAGWLAVAATWALRHGRWLGEPRADGGPG